MVKFFSGKIFNRSLLKTFPLGFLRFVHKLPGDAVSPSGLLPFSAVSRNAFRPGEPRNGPESRFFFKDPIFIWEKGNLGALSLPGASLLLGEIPKVEPPFGPVSGGRQEKLN